ncbi:IS21-like element helper ATPase IstB [Methylophaga thalassica]|jgi:DNA replication protein DnaC|uniref:IS21-like element helper ATPase IstB n=1 Tax=Methylophaga aminisulfidivorans TaxID=230105 RepID=UPI000C4E0C96|nr:IS21-like element helper ATPase IstB [Methylophaga aminisulfidivorans]MBL52294.1 transposase [Alteromonadaceae bacterium]|tara:strand:- start:11 stop:757 length:747 start_codon:yes stop_codon:yes gene_type:complete
MTQSQLQEQLRSLRLGHFAQALQQQQGQATTYEDMSFEERLGLLAQHEIHCRQSTKVKRLLKQASLRLDAHASRLKYRSERGLRKDKIGSLLSGQYLHHAHNIIITGATGCGKTYLACALAKQACEQHQTVRYYRLGQLLDELNIGHADGSYRQQLAQIAKKKLLILDDWGMEKLNARQANDLLDVMEERYQNASTIIASQLPVAEWYKLMTNPTVADALLDRLLHNSHRIELTGESMRKLDQSDHLR